MNSNNDSSLLKWIESNITQADNVYTSDILNNFKPDLNLFRILVSVLGTFIIVVNFAVVVSSGLILKNKQTRQTTYIFMGNLALTDLVTGLAIVSENVFPLGIRGHFSCVIQIGVIVSSTLIAVFSVGLIAIDRFLYIIYGLYYEKWVSPTRSKIIILFTWSFGCIIGFLPLFGWHQDRYDGKWCWFVLITPKELILLTIALAIIPIIIVLVLYSIILYYALRKVIQLQDSTEPNIKQSNLRMFRGNGRIISESTAVQNQDPKCVFRKFFKKKPKANSPTKWKAIKVVLFTTSAFVLTWCPYFIATICYIYNTSNVELSLGYHIKISNPLAILGYVNCLINPIIYAWWHNGFRNFIKKQIFLKIRDRIHKPTEKPANISSIHCYANEAVSVS